MEPGGGGAGGGILGELGEGSPEGSLPAHPAGRPRDCAGPGDPLRHAAEPPICWQTPGSDFSLASFGWKSLPFAEMNMCIFPVGFIVNLSLFNIFRFFVFHGLKQIMVVGSKGLSNHNCDARGSSPLYGGGSL